jgi:hypothetical protein
VPSRLPILSALFLLLALCGSALAQLPRAIVTGPREARCGSLIVLDASESTGTGRLWLLAVSPEETSFLPVESGIKAIFASPTPGRYTFVLVVSGVNSNGGPAADMATHSVTLSGGTPPQPPGPQPPNPPTPPVNAGRRLIVVLRETESSDVATATAILKLRTDQQILDRLKAKNHPSPLILDRDSQSPLVDRLKLEAGRLPLPLLFVLDYSAGDDGATISKAPMPANAAGIVEALTKAGG